VLRRGAVRGGVDVLLRGAAPRRGVAGPAAILLQRRGWVAPVPREERPHGWAAGRREREE
jgi:hypothetical protein